MTEDEPNPIVLAPQQYHTNLIPEAQPQS